MSLEATFSHEPLVRDMTHDMLSRIQTEEGMPRALRRRVDRSFDTILESHAFSTVIFTAGSFAEGAGLNERELFAQEHAEALHPVVLDATEEVGKLVMSSITAPMRFKYQYYPIITVPDIDEKLTASEWVREIWAPDYADRFVDAVVAQDAMGVAS